MLQWSPPRQSCLGLKPGFNVTKMEDFNLFPECTNRRVGYSQYCTKVKYILKNCVANSFSPTSDTQSLKVSGIFVQTHAQVIQKSKYEYDSGSTVKNGKTIASSRLCELSFFSRRRHAWCLRGLEPCKLCFRVDLTLMTSLRSPVGDRVPSRKLATSSAGVVERERPSFVTTSSSARSASILLNTGGVLG